MVLGCVTYCTRHVQYVTYVRKCKRAFRYSSIWWDIAQPRDGLRREKADVAAAEDVAHSLTDKSGHQSTLVGRKQSAAATITLQKGKTFGLPKSSFTAAAAASMDIIYLERTFTHVPKKDCNMRRVVGRFLTNKL
jgi:hypothetical protein